MQILILAVDSLGVNAPKPQQCHGLTMGDMFERLRISMPQNDPGSLTRQQYVDILAFMLRSGTFPEGKTELPRETERLRLITFEAMKP